ncbi:hypothetical protein L0P50_18795, partial [Lawsonibacter sp. DFI.6.74]|nr:hypothetical protein [Lawsonibacter sp. DFI.6.74]
RGFDLNPFAASGVTQEQLDFLHLFFTYLLSLPKAAESLTARMSEGQQLNETIALEDATKASAQQAKMQMLMTSIRQFITTYQLDQ